MEKMTTIPMVKLAENNWGYICTGYCDSIEIEYYERDNDKEVIRSTFLIPSYISVQVLEEMLKIAKEVEKNNP